MWSPFVLSKQTESQMTDFTQLFFGQALRLLPLRRQSKTHPNTRLPPVKLLGLAGERLPSSIAARPKPVINKTGSKP
ncbi:hypothetical protein CN110_24710 [Sinorhizobium meliloti]|nr:hypothetical protein CN162_33565 [Sinorhizobium meliloti]RVM76361.1 hypothetical protein CN122_35375 [Sinorhizobium meliloti]RVN67848.1 hypothetical protein CN110_24710 [Sinorhizobium meliloti]